MHDDTIGVRSGCGSVGVMCLKGTDWFHKELILFQMLRSRPQVRGHHSYPAQYIQARSRAASRARK